MLVSVSLNSLVGQGESLKQSDLRIVVESLVIQLADSFHRDPTGFLPALVSTHAIGDHGQAAFAMEFFFPIGFPVKTGVFIILANTPDIGQTGHFHAGPDGFAVNRHRRGATTCVESASL